MRENLTFTYDNGKWARGVAIYVYIYGFICTRTLTKNYDKGKNSVSKTVHDCDDQQSMQDWRPATVFSANSPILHHWYVRGRAHVCMCWCPNGWWLRHAAHTQLVTQKPCIVGVCMYAQDMIDGLFSVLRNHLQPLHIRTRTIVAAPQRIAQHVTAVCMHRTKADVINGMKIRKWLNQERESSVWASQSRSYHTLSRNTWHELRRLSENFHDFTLPFTTSF